MIWKSSRSGTGNHTIYGLLDIPMFGLEVWEKTGRSVRGVVGHNHYKLPTWRDLLQSLGAVRGTRENCARLYILDTPVGKLLHALDITEQPWFRGTRSSRRSRAARARGCFRASSASTSCAASPSTRRATRANTRTVKRASPCARR